MFGADGAVLFDSLIKYKFFNNYSFKFTQEGGWTVHFVLVVPICNQQMFMNHYLEVRIHIMLYMDIPLLQFMR